MLDTEQQQTKIESAQNLIAELCISAPSDEVKQCLRTYEYGKTLAQLEKDFNKFRKNVLESTLTYLKVENQEQFVKPANINSLICRLQNLLPDECSICKEAYCIKIDDIPLLACAFCGQEVHRECYLQLLGATTMDYDTKSFQKVFNPLNLPGLHYVCKPCELVKIPQDDCGKKIKFSKSKDATPANHTTTTAQPVHHPPAPDLTVPDPDTPNPPQINSFASNIYPDLDNIDSKMKIMKFKSKMMINQDEVKKIHWLIQEKRVVILFNKIVNLD